MQDLIQLVYISRVTEALETESTIQTVNQQILSEAHAFNQEHEITGILCYGNHCYLQLIEGPKNAVELLYTKIIKDQRHQDIKLMFKEPISMRSFASWYMKYLDDVSVTMPLVRMHGHKHFNPFEFAENLCKDLIEFLSQKCAYGKS